MTNEQKQDMIKIVKTKLETVICFAKSDLEFPEDEISEKNVEILKQDIERGINILLGAKEILGKMQH